MLKTLLAPLGLLFCSFALAGTADWFGEAGDESAVAMPVSEVMAQVDALDGQTLTVSGRITDVCTNRGCWAVFEDNGEMLRIKVRDHAFAIPEDARGPAIAHGVLERVEVSREHAEHLVEADGADASLLEQDYEYRLITEGVRLTAAP